MKDRHGNEFVWVPAELTQGMAIGAMSVWADGSKDFGQMYAAAIAAAPKFAAPEVARPMCHGAWARFWSEPNTGDSCDQARRWLEAWRAELGPSLGLVEIREPTDDECRNIWREAKVNEGDGSKVCAGRAIFDAVKIVMCPKSEGL